MRGSGRSRYSAVLGVAALAVAAVVGRAAGQSAPAAPSYSSVLRSIESTRRAWSGGASGEAAGWNTLFDQIARDLESFVAAKDSGERFVALSHIDRFVSALEPFTWAPAVEIREALRGWLAPRVRLSDAERRLQDVLATESGADSTNHRTDWLTFLDQKLNPVLNGYESAKTVQARLDALRSLRHVLDALRATSSWTYAAELQAAADGLFNAPNLDVSADVAALAPVLSNQVVMTGPIYRNGYWSQVTAGPYAGFGLASSDQGIAFTNSQYLTSVTPITDFQRQIESDQKGRRVAKLYDFSATTINNGLMTITAIVTPFGLSLIPSPGNSVDAQIASEPIAGKGLQRAVLGLIGFGQRKITDKVYDSAIGKIRQNVETEGLQEARERSAAAAAEQNAKLREVLRGDGNATVKDIEIEGLRLQSRPTNALIGGTVKWASGPNQGGADIPQPPRFAAPASGLSADVHIGSIANNIVRGFLQSPDAADVSNLMIETRKVEPGTTPKDAVKITKNVDFPTYLKAVDQANAANSPETQALRIKKPSQPPDFGVDAKGNLVIIAHDLQLDLPVPAQVANSRLGGAPSKVFRLVAGTAEFIYQIKPVTEPDGTIRLKGNLVDFVPGPGAKVLAINDDEAKALPLDPFRSVFVYRGFATAIKSKPLDVPLENLKLRGYVITSISELDPSGWMRVVLTPTGERPLAQAGP